jgi:hypothetical protein
MTQKDSRPAGNRAAQQTVTTPSATNSTASRQVSWWDVHEHVTPLLREVGSWPAAGTPAWCALDADDPVKLAALLDAAQHWALRVETCQEAEIQASHDISGAADWSAIAAQHRNRAGAIASGAYIRKAAVAS